MHIFVEIFPMAVPIQDIINSMNTLEVNPGLMLSYYESKIEETEKVLYDFKSKLSFLKKKIKNNTPFEITELNMQLANIKWRAEIRMCITPLDPKKFYLATSSEISSCIAINNNIQVITRDIKSKISSTLSLMFKEREVGRYGGENGKDYQYGISNFFESDMVTLKKEYVKRLPELDQYK